MNARPVISSVCFVYLLSWKSTKKQHLLLSFLLKTYQRFFENSTWRHPEATDWYFGRVAAPRYITTARLIVAAEKVKGCRVVMEWHTQRGIGLGRGHCRSWSFFFLFCGALPPDHLHQVDIRRVYSGVCNCILSPVLHCRPWKWNLINPDQFLMYKMNWQGFKRRGELQFKSGEWYTAIFVQWMIELPGRHPPPHPPTHSPPLHHLITPCLQLSYYTGFIFLSEDERARGERWELHEFLCVIVLYACGYAYWC